MKNSGEHSKSKGGLGRKLGLALLLLLACLALFGPNLVFKGAMGYARVAAEKRGLTLDYSRARAGFLFNSLELESLSLCEGGEKPLTRWHIGKLRLDGLSFTALFRLWRGLDMAALEEALPLADGLFIDALEGETPAFALRLGRGSIIRPALPPAGGAAAFEQVMADSLNFVERRNTGASFVLSRLEARRAGEKITLLRLENLLGRGPDNPLTIELGALTAGGVDAEALRRALEGASPLAFLTFCDTLDLVQVALIREDGQELVRLRKALFDVDDQGHSRRYSRALDFRLNVAALAESAPELAGEAAFMALMESGNALDLNLNLNLAYRPSGGRVELYDSGLESPTLGRLALGGRLSGVAAIKPGFTPYQLLFSSDSWVLENLALSFRDAGFMPAWYRALDASIFQASPKGQSAENLMREYVAPLAAALAEENGLANLPALASETEAFLKRPEYLALNCAPPEPLNVLSLAKLEKYAIIDKLNLSVQVNQRAPVTFAAHQGVDYERLPSAPRPLENSFTEETL